ncbi:MULTISPECIES: helix-hairpin-helix domain-containing protein [unclassified Herbaspirillum]|uniref:ComEA family DNA-binding protein n=1 Tax=unclassified Herbaspirillum TaxID=2624150 RepID=UPI0011530FFF|nr:MULTISPECIES: helix-hairpin-helix domain-containing protein [unclassified Herbaspirillum]MBB5391226.1 competence protein ComEA [Herbaspirillum sp. SJZ102]TQK13084.1 competence protein ComEA [Herbaspirillum sp. SJZ130]TQK15088.1 competence protein ComEA [Herbaspirillum sp. SJZ106]TWC67433.1 competence protein ComEA [Herbaspirillum sp. SJZ099]
MLKKFLLFIATALMAAGFAFAQVDVNKADQAALDGIRGIGPAMSKRILEERQKGGSFKDWDDLQNRVKGIKEKSAAKLSANGLTVNGKSRPEASGQPAKGGKAAPAGDKPAETAKK